LKFASQSKGCGLILHEVFVEIPLEKQQFWHS